MTTDVIPLPALGNGRLKHLWGRHVGRKTMGERSRIYRPWYNLPRQTIPYPPGHDDLTPPCKMP